jgi:hypothetical protein
MQLGLPIIASDLPSTREVCDDACKYFSNPRNAIKLAEDLKAFWLDKDIRQDLAEKGYARSRFFSLGKIESDLSQAVNHVISDQLKEKYSFLRPGLPSPKPFTQLSVFLLYEDLTTYDMDELLSIDDINSFHSSIFGAEAQVTVGFDFSYARNKTLSSLFSKAERLICYNSRSLDGISFATQEFSMRNDDGEYHLVTRYPVCKQKYSPKKIRASVLCLNLFPKANYLVIDQNNSDCVLHLPPDERGGILDFENRQRSGPILYDIMIRRETVESFPHGTYEYLSRFCLNARKLSIAELPD